MPREGRSWCEGWWGRARERGPLRLFDLCVCVFGMLTVESDVCVIGCFLLVLCVWRWGRERGGGFSRSSRSRRCIHLVFVFFSSPPALASHTHRHTHRRTNPSYYTPFIKRALSLERRGNVLSLFSCLHNTNQPSLAHHNAHHTNQETTSCTPFTPARADAARPRPLASTGHRSRAARAASRG